MLHAHFELFLLGLKLSYYTTISHILLGRFNISLSKPPGIGIYLPHTSLKSVLDLRLGWYENHKKHPIPGAGWCVQKLITDQHLSMYTREYILLSPFFPLFLKNSLLGFRIFKGFDFFPQKQNQFPSDCLHSHRVANPLEFFITGKIPHLPWIWRELWGCISFPVSLHLHSRTKPIWKQQYSFYPAAQEHLSNPELNKNI